MKKNPKVSVIIPVFNGEKTLNQCLRSVLDQTYNNYEVIIVNNNSTDGTKGIIEEFQKKDRKIKYVFENCRLRGAARNSGEKIAEGQIILMTDSDCTVPKYWIEGMIGPILKEGYMGVQGSENIPGDNFWSEEEQIRIKNKEKIKKIDMQEFNNAVGLIDTNNFAISTKALKNIGLTSRKYFCGNDAELSMRIKKNNLKIKSLNSIKVKHFRKNSFGSVINRYYNRGFWIAIITKDHKEFLRSTSYLKETNQTMGAFVKFFPGLIKLSLTNGLRYAYFELITGLAFRAGLIKGGLKK